MNNHKNIYNSTYTKLKHIENQLYCLGSYIYVQIDSKNCKEKSENNRGAGKHQGDKFKN